MNQNLNPNVTQFLYGNKYVIPIILLILVLYAAIIAPDLSENVASIFDKPIVNILLLFLIIYVTMYSPSIGLIAAIGLMVSLITLNNYKNNKKINQLVQKQTETMKSTRSATPTITPTEITLEKIEIDSTIDQTQNIPDDALSALKTEPSIQPCQTKSKSKQENMFYPQYMHTKKEIPEARYTDGTVSGFDSTTAYASI